MSADEQALKDLLSSADFSGVPVEKMLSAAREARRRRSELHEFTGRLIATLNKTHGMSFADIGRMLEMSHSTAHHMAKKYM